MPEETPLKGFWQFTKHLSRVYKIAGTGLILGMITTSLSVLGFINEGNRDYLYLLGTNVIFFITVVVVAIYAERMLRANKKESEKELKTVRERLEMELKTYKEASESKINLLESELKDLKEIRKSRFNISCSRSISGCFVESPKGEEPKWNCLLVCVGFDGDHTRPITDCQGVLQKVTKDAREIIPRVNVPLIFAPGSRSIIISDEEYLNVIKVNEPNDAQLYRQQGSVVYPGGINYDELFSERGTYILRIRITGNGTAPTFFSLKFIWTGDWQTADLYKIDEVAKET
jgi:hypothetical protein